MGLFSELKNRRVFATAAIYIPVAWLAVEIITALLDRFNAPHWMGDVVSVLFVLGFPVTLLLSWLFDFTRDGVKRTSAGTPVGIVALLAAGLFLSTSAYVSYQVFSGRITEISVAILPLKTNALDSAAQPYGSGIADSLRSSLQRISVFRVPAHTSSEAVVKAGLDIPGIASKLDVEFIVEGTLEMIGQNLNISLSLIDSSGDVRWTERFERATRDLFSLQNDLVRAVALELGLDESDAQLQKNIKRPAPTQDMEAHRLYLVGKYTGPEPGVSFEERSAIKILQAARERDPGYAAVYAALAFEYAKECWAKDDRRSPDCEIAVNYANQGLRLDPDQADALTTLALVHSVRYEYQEAQAAIDSFLALDIGTLETSSLPWAYLNLGHFQLAWDSALEFYRDDPLNIYALGNLALWAAELKNDDVMAEYYENIMIEMMGFSILYGYPATRTHRVDLQTAIRDARSVFQFWGITPDAADLMIPSYYDPTLRQSTAEELQAWHERGDVRLAIYWAWLIDLGQIDRAVNMAFDLHDQAVLNPVMLWLGQMGRKEARNHPRFMELMEYIGLTSYWDESGWPLFCELRESEYFCGLDFQVE
jgi:TolB-like protein